jgi:quinol monooxygenase YgiN
LRPFARLIHYEYYSIVTWVAKGAKAMSMVIVRYRTKADRAEENAAYVRKVYEELARTAPAGLRYATFKASDSPTFFHIASVETADGANPLQQVEAFKAFTAKIQDRCEEPPVTTVLEAVGSYHFFE